MRRNLRTRLLVFMLLGIAGVTIIQLVTSGWGLMRVRNRGIGDSSAALETQTQSSLLELTQTNATLTAQTIISAQQIGLSLSQLLVDPPPVAEVKAVEPFFLAADKRRYQQGATTVVIPRSPEISTLNEVNFSLGLEIILPTVTRLSPEILRVPYTTVDGILRTYPPVLPADVPVLWSTTSDLGLQIGSPSANPERGVVWMNTHQVFAGIDTVISAVQPVYRDSAFVGVVQVDLSAERLTESLERIKVGQSGFPIVLGNDGSLTTSTENGERTLFGHVIGSQEERNTVQLVALHPELGSPDLLVIMVSS